MSEIENLAWVLPRPNKSKYIGSFPLHFEKKLLRLLDIDPEKDKILHPFGGKAEFGIRCDINPDVNPDYVCDAHSLPFGDNEFDLVILDPPYGEDYAQRLYDTKKYGKLRFKTYTAEAVRVCKEGGFVVCYHNRTTPSIPNTFLVRRILLEHRIWHSARVIHIHQKVSGIDYKSKNREAVTRQISLADAKYIAAAADFEGYFHIGKAKNKKIKRGFGWSIYFTVNNTNSSIIKHLKTIAGGNEIQTVKPRKKTHKVQYRYTIMGNELRLLLPQIIPHLIIKKKQAVLLDEALDITKKTWKNSRGGWNNDVRLEEIYQKVRKLNKRGR